MGIGNNELIEFEQSYNEELVEEFLKANDELWHKFVEASYHEKMADIGDSLLDARKEEGLL